MKLRIIFLASITAALVACSGETPETGTTTEPAPLPEQTPIEGVTAAEQEALASFEESAGEEAPVDEAIEIAVAEPESAEAIAERQWRFQEGRHFKRLTTAQGTSGAAGKVEVAEIFWYGCPHCYNFEPIVQDWASRASPDVSFVQIPVMWNPTNEIHARAFYTAQALGVLDEIHGDFFREIHIENNPLATEAALQDFFEDHGVSEEDFEKTFRSFAVSGKLRQAQNFTQRYRVRSVPIIVVNGKYTTDGAQIASLQQKLQIVDELIERERQDQ